jgi:toluene monooxygenase electron transfer component
VPIGAQVTLDGPYGLAYLRPESPRDIVLIGGGSGLAPVLSLARGAVADPRLDGRKIHVFYGARGVRDLCGNAELEALPGFGTRITFTPVLSEPQAGPGHLAERPDSCTRSRATSSAARPDFEYYFAGRRPWRGRAADADRQARAVPAGSLR